MPHFSPGPWEYDAVAGTVYDDTGRAMCDSVHATDYDCRLIAAAPEMLAVLEMFIKNWRGSDVDWFTQCYEIEKLAEIAIAKAKCGKC